MRRRRSEVREKREQEWENTPQYTIDVPNDPLNEQVVLAAALVDKSFRKKIVKRFPSDAFYAEEHKAIFSALCELTRRNLRYDPAVLARLAPDVDIRILETLAEARPELPPNIDFHIETLGWDWQRARATQGPIAQLLEAVQNPKESAERVKALARSVGEAFDGEYSRGRFLRDPKEVVREAMNKLRRRVEGEAYYPYGIPGLDFYETGVRRIRPGAAPGTMAMITALSGSGKSTVIGHAALGLARQRRKILFGAWEEDAPVTIELLTTLSLKWSRSRILDGKSNRLKEDGGDDDYEPLEHEELVIFEERAHAISKYVQFFSNPFQRQQTTRTGRRVTNDDHLDIVHDHLAESGAEVFIADLWQRCLVETAPEDERHALFRQLAIVQEQRVHLLMAHQQRAKDIETRADKRPTREGIIGSGAWLDVCWLVMAPHIPAKWKNIPDTTLEVYILKQRNGPWPLAVEFDWDPDTGQITGGKSIPVNAVESSEDTMGDFLAGKKRGKKRQAA